MSIEQVARSFHLPERTIKRWVRQGRIPVDRSGSSFTFDLQVIQKRAAARKPTFTFDSQPAAEPDSEHAERLLTAMQLGNLISGFKAVRSMRCCGTRFTGSSFSTRIADRPYTKTCCSVNL